MNSSAEGKNSLDKNRQQTADPFAADIFADSGKSETLDSIENQRVEMVEKAEWVWRLPKAARSQKNWTNLLQNLPVEFSENLVRQLAQCLTNLLNTENENSIDFAFVENREVDAEKKKNDKSGETENFWRALIAIEPGASEFTIEIEDVFAGWLVDKMLSENVLDTVQQRDLTRSETAVLEYIFVNLVYETNAVIKKSLLKFISLSRKSPRPITSENLKDSKTKIVSTWQTLAAPRSLVKLFLASESLEALQNGKDIFSNGAEKQAKTLRAVENYVREVRARLFLGETQTTLADIAGIETGDVILIERYDLNAKRNEFYGSAELFLGEGETFRIAGSIERSDFESSNETESSFDGTEMLVRRVNLSHNLRFSISHFELPPDGNFTEKSMNEDFANLSDQTAEDMPDESDGNGISLENLAVNLRVELEARRLTLVEIGNLRVNQVIELGARATDPVNLIIDNKTIARGELVEVENRLGVRIIQILR